MNLTGVDRVVISVASFHASNLSSNPMLSCLHPSSNPYASPFFTYLGSPNLYCGLCFGPYG